jgi:3-keto-5-aminohexanoate cleavage enzyme
VEKLIITVAITGGSSPEDNPYLPKNPEEQVKATLEAYEAGASIVHLHSRDHSGRCVHEARFFEEVILPIREQCDILINTSTGGVAKRVDGEHIYQKTPGTSPEDRVGIIPHLAKNPKANPDLASFNCGSPIIDIYSKTKKQFLYNFVMVHTFSDMAYIAGVMKEHGIKPEIECYDVGMINNAIVLKECGFLEEPLHFQCVLGIMGCIPATVDNLAYMVRTIPPGSTWSVCAVGLDEFKMATMAIIIGGHVRVGFEDNIYISKGVKAKSNAEQVAKVVRLAKELDRNIATPEDARRILHLSE